MWYEIELAHDFTDGFLFEDLLPVRVVLEEYFDVLLSNGAILFASVFGVTVLIKILRNLVHFEGEARVFRVNTPTENSRFFKMPEERALIKEDRVERMAQRAERKKNRAEDHATYLARRTQRIEDQKERDYKFKEDKHYNQGYRESRLRFWVWRTHWYNERTPKPEDWTPKKSDRVQYYKNMQSYYSRMDNARKNSSTRDSRLDVVRDD